MSGDTKTRILGAAIDGFAAKGVGGTSLDSVANSAGIRKQTLLYWFASKDLLLEGVVDFALDEVSARFVRAVIAANPRQTPGVSPKRSERASRSAKAIANSVFRIGSEQPELLTVLREVVLAGPPASDRLAERVEALAGGATSALINEFPGSETEETQLKRVREVVLAASAQVLGWATEAQIRADLGLPADMAWLRNRRQQLIDLLLDTGVDFS